ncbi:FAD-dependent oxidoreductase [Photorhabdus luminescens]|uniref:FAD-binding oxidoreductase n=1 Tax=Photorhabdus luminescens subsp. sonorensis TaxID=1173677 RepID=A0A5C4RGQ3_PHOLU|nr:FAD-dependent oxidoreductase [Photorhabdus luminescens]TNH42948.1 FAD-binding oxidoreductase [Photorhabdus luminescens subsp. sonorensis]
MNKINIAIIGGGIIGTIIAKEIKKLNPELSIAILEKRLLGFGSSFYSAGVHFPRGNSEYVRKMSLYSHEYYQKMITEGAPIYPLTTELITERNNKKDTLDSYLSLTEFMPIKSSSNKDIDISLLPEINIFQGKGCHYADVFNVVNLLIRKLRPLIKIYEGTSVNTLQKLTKGYQLGLSTGEQLEVEKVILSPGSWIAEPAWCDQVSSLGIRVKKIVAAHIRQIPKPQDPLTIFHDEDAFLLPCHNRGHWLFSYTSQEWDVEPQNIYALEPKDLSEARDVLSKYSPSLAQKIYDGRVFCDAYSVSRKPIITYLDENLIFAGATNGAGYRLAPAIAANVIKLLLQINS